METSDPDILIVGSLRDIHVQRVCELLPEGCRPLIIDYSNYPQLFSASLHIDTDIHAIITANNGLELNLSKVNSVWWRRPLAFNTTGLHDRYLQDYIDIQCDFFWSSIMSCLPNSAVWYNPWHSDQYIDRNAKQLCLARNVGLATPDTLITSNIESAEHFISKYPKVIFKAFGGSRKIWHPTRPFSSRASEILPLIANCPVIFQEYIEGNFDFRVTIIDDEIETVQFDTGASYYPFDVRIDKNINCRRVTLSAQLEYALHSLVKSMNLRFAAIDLRQAIDGKFYFLELNPSGQFIYLDRRAGTRIAERLAKKLSVGSTNVNIKSGLKIQFNPIKNAVKKKTGSLMPFAVAFDQSIR